VFDVDEHTGGNALFFVCYGILHRLGLPAHFGMDDAVLRNFLLAIQAGYHPNPYHNATHAADVCHILSYIVNWGGLQKVCPLVPEEVLAAVLAGAIHDYDHPGFNNNFHTRTNAYLSTLYNDRSILENHHLACVFEMMRLPKYNIFAGWKEEFNASEDGKNDPRREVRDFMVEMVLSTDMGLHGKKMMEFQNKLQVNSDWLRAKPEELKLLLSMCTKMADTSNCGRPTNLYTRWAKNIAAEFYDQGDVEARLKLDISPFMDRSRHMSDFAKGQSSFISFVIEPMFQTMVEVLPELEFVLDYAQANKAYWQDHSPGDLGDITARSKKRSSDDQRTSRSTSIADSRASTAKS